MECNSGKKMDDEFRKKGRIIKSIELKGKGK